jgi:ABC-2 type transport system permease protein
MDAAGVTSLTESFVLPTYSLWRREVVLFLRQRSRIVGALGTPLLFWLFIGSGLNRSFAPGGGTGTGSYLVYLFPGAIVLIVLFTAIFATISVIEDRQAGFLQSVLAAPVDRSAIAVGKVLGSSTLAMIQAMLFLVLAPLAGIPLGVGSTFAVLGVALIVSLALSALGLQLAWRIGSSQGYHAVMNMLLFPMWLLSGAFFPSTGASKWVSWIMAVNPLTYGVAAMRHALYWGSPDLAPGYPSFGLSLTVTLVFAAAMTGLAIRTVATRS